MAQCLFWTFSSFEIKDVFEQVIIVTCNKLQINEVKCWSSAHTVKYHYQNCSRPSKFARSSSVKYSVLYTVVADKVECSCHFPASGRSFMTRCQHYKTFLIEVRYHSMRTLKSADLYCNRCWTCCPYTCPLSHLNRLNFKFFLTNFKNLSSYVFL